MHTCLQPSVLRGGRGKDDPFSSIADVSFCLLDTFKRSNRPTQINWIGELSIQTWHGTKMLSTVPKARYILQSVVMFNSRGCAGTNAISGESWGFNEPKTNTYVIYIYTYVCVCVWIALLLATKWPLADSVSWCLHTSSHNSVSSHWTDSDSMIIMMSTMVKQPLVHYNKGFLLSSRGIIFVADFADLFFWIDWGLL